MFGDLGTHRGDACVLWPGFVSNYGYGVVHLRKGPGGLVFVHRVAWERANGPIPEGMVIDHQCSVRSCVNVDHLQVVDRGENTLLGFSRAAGHDSRRFCKNGHEWTPENTYTRPRGGHRQCRACVAAIQRRKREALKDLTETTPPRENPPPCHG